MADDDWRRAERTWKKTPDDPEAVERALAAARRARVPVPYDLFERERTPGVAGIVRAIPRLTIFRAARVVFGRFARAVAARRRTILRTGRVALGAVARPVGAAHPAVLLAGLACLVGLAGGVPAEGGGGRRHRLAPRAPTSGIAPAVGGASAMTPVAAGGGGGRVSRCRAAVGGRGPAGGRVGVGHGCDPFS